MLVNDDDDVCFELFDVYTEMSESPFYHSIMSGVFPPYRRRRTALVRVNVHRGFNFQDI